jgi:hypothetical protein
VKFELASEDELDAVAFEARRALDIAADEFIRTVFPVGLGTSDAPLRTPEQHALDPATIREAFMRVSQSAMFHVFCIIDGVSDPKDWRESVWLGLGLVRREEDQPMLHDAFMDGGD